MVPPMAFKNCLSILSILAYSQLAVASVYLSPPVGLTNIASERWPGASIEYKQTTICETSARAWSGYMNMPADVLNRLENVHDTFDSHLFFWYFESRHDPANSPTAIFLGGGPGYTSLDHTTGFPCLIKSFDSYEHNPFSWNNNINMLYIDQPAGVGYSYVNLENGTYNALNHTFEPLQDGEEVTDIDVTSLPATMDPSPLETIVNTTAQASRVLWQFAQIFFQEFPEKPTVEDSISVWGGSYGGFWASGALSHFIDQNEKVSGQTHPNENATVLPLGTLGIINGFVDFKVQGDSFASFSFNNTYGIQILNETFAAESIEALSAPDEGCYALIDKCRAAVAELDPTRQGNNEEVNSVCLIALGTCFPGSIGLYDPSGHSTFDIAQIKAKDDMDDSFVAFFNQRWVQEDLGVYKNFTYNVDLFQEALFRGTMDVIVNAMSTVEHILDAGLNVAYLYGDRDYICNWVGGEAVSLAAEYEGAHAFRAAGYMDIEVNSSYIGGHVRQHAGVSFSRIFDAPHAVSADQPETSLLIFERAMFGLDIATGTMQGDHCYSSPGPASSWCRNRVPEPQENICVIYKARDSCTADQKAALEDGSATVEGFVLSSPAGESLVNRTIVDLPADMEWCN